MKYFEKSLLAAVAVALLLGCGDAQDPTTPSDQAHDDTKAPVSTEPLPPSEGFSWVVPGELAAMPLPGRNRPLDQDAAFLEQEGITVLVSLTDERPDGEILASNAIRQEHFPVEDYTPPTLQQMIEFTALVEASAAAGDPVGVHCTAGLGRSGTMAAAYLVSKGATADEAIATLRELRPGSVETPEQEEAVRLFAEDLQSKR